MAPRRRLSKCHSNLSPFLLKAGSVFGVLVPKMNNNFLIPILGKKTPYGTALGIYLGGVGYKGYGFYEDAKGESN